MPAKNAMTPNTNNVASMNRAPSARVWRATEPRAGDVNCGKNARKNSDTLGLVRFMMMPRRNRTPYRRAGTVDGSGRVVLLSASEDIMALCAGAGSAGWVLPGGSDWLPVLSRDGRRLSQARYSR